jgi:hypothetical protein
MYRIKNNHRTAVRCFIYKLSLEILALKLCFSKGLLRHFRSIISVVIITLPCSLIIYVVEANVYIFFFLSKKILIQINLWVQVPFHKIDHDILRKFKNNCRKAVRHLMYKFTLYDLIIKLYFSKGFSDILGPSSVLESLRDHAHWIF